MSLDRSGDHLAIDRQREDCLDLLNRHGWTLHREYVDNSVSASSSHTRRPGYDALVADFAAGGFDALICWDLDRLTRQPRQLEDWIDAATDRGLRIVTANGEADLGTDGGRMYARIKASVARAEIERKGARQKRAQQQRAEHGRAPAGVRLTGYNSDGSAHEDEARLVRELFARFQAGDSLKALAADLDARGVRTRSGRPWNPSTIRTVLANPRYAGWSVHRGVIVMKDGDRVRGTWAPLVTEGTWESVRARLSDPARATNRVGTHRKHLGSGLYRCGTCDQPLRSWSGDRYRCAAGHLTRAQSNVDATVLATVAERLASPDLSDLLPNRNDATARAAAEQVAEERRRLAVVEHDYDEGLIDGHRYATASAKIIKRLNAAAARHSALIVGAGAAAVLAAPDPAGAFEGATLGVQRNVIDALVTVHLHPAPRGRRTFDGGTVTFGWR